MATRADRYWEQYLESLPPDQRRPDAHAGGCTFGITPDDAREIADLVLNGTKTATGSLIWSNEADGKPTPRPGDLWVVLAGADEPVGVIQTTEIRIIPYDEVSERYAWEGGEGERTLADWRRIYWACIVSECKRIGRDPDRKAPLAMERFRVVYAEPLRGQQAPPPRSARAPSGIWRCSTAARSWAY